MADKSLLLLLPPNEKFDEKDDNEKRFSFLLYVTNGAMGINFQKIKPDFSV
jgi:hypothetical protein